MRKPTLSDLQYYHVDWWERFRSYHGTDKYTYLLMSCVVPDAFFISINLYYENMR